MKAIGRSVGRHVGGEVLEAGRRGILGGQALRDSGGEVGATVGPVRSDVRKVDLVGHAVDEIDVLGVGHHQVPEAGRVCRRPQQWIVDGIDGAVAAAVAGIVEKRALLHRVGIGDDVVVLEVDGGIAGGQVVVDRRLLAEHALELGRHVGDVPVAHLGAQLGRHLGLVQFVVAVAHAAQCIDDHLGAGEHSQLVADGAEVGLDLPRLGLPRRGQLVVDRLFECIAAAHIAQHGGNQDGDGAQQDQGGEQLRRQPPA